MNELGIELGKFSVSIGVISDKLNPKVEDSYSE